MKNWTENLRGFTPSVLEISDNFLCFELVDWVSFRKEKKRIEREREREKREKR